MNIKKPKSLKLYEQVASIIEQQIQENQIVPGQKLESVEKLAETFGVGRSAIREALTSLQSRGILEIRHGEGTFVKKISVRDITLHVPTYLDFNLEELHQIFELRKILELGLIEQAAIRRTDAQLLALEQTLLQMDSPALSSIESSYADLHFHTLIAEAANNPIIVSVLESVSKPIANQIQITRDIVSKSNPSKLHHFNHEHLDIFQAIKQRNAILAKKAMKNHLLSVEQLLFNTRSN